jgi:hypothetical protein
MKRPYSDYEALQDDEFGTELTPHTETVDHINPSHYKMIPPSAFERFPEGIEYFDLMSFVLSHHEPFDAHGIGQSLKYLLRAGKKDPLVQDLKKARWYLDYLIAFHEFHESK